MLNRRGKRRRLLAWIGAAGLLASVMLNGIAWRQARAMTHFSAAGRKTAGAEHLGVWQKAVVLVKGVNLPRPENHHTPADFGLNSSTRRISTTQENQIELWRVPQEPSRGTIVMFHGYGGCKESLLPAAKAFHRMGFACVLVDFRGSGGSTGNVTTLGWYEADDVAAAYDFARKETPNDPVILYGGSMGAAAILRSVAVRQIRPEALILECPFDRLLTTVANRFHLMGLPAFPCAQLLVFWGGVQCNFDGFAHNPVEYARQVRCPTLLLQGEQDPRARLQDAQAVFDALPAQKTFKVFTSLAHQSYIEAAPDEWKQSVTEFLKQFDPTSETQAEAH